MVEPGHDKISPLSRPSLDDASETNNGKASFAKLGSLFLLNDMLFEILSWLPAKCLGRCKCVCKKWYDMIENRSFAIKHFSRSPRVDVICDEHKVQFLDVGGFNVQERFRIMKVFTGLVVEKGVVYGKYRLRNLTTQEIVYLPDPHQRTYDLLAHMYDYPSGEIKLVSVYREDNNPRVEGFEYFNFDRDDKWRPLKFPVLEKPERSTPERSAVLCTNDTFYHVKGVRDGSKVYIDVYSFDMTSLCCFSTCLPQGSFSYLSTVLLLNWNGCLAFGVIVEEKLNVIVLEDHKRSKWSETKIVLPLTYLKDHPNMRCLVPGALNRGILTFQPDYKGRLFCYDTRSRKVTQAEAPGIGKRFTIHPSVVTFKRNAIGQDASTANL